MLLDFTRSAQLRIHSHICSLAYPILEMTSELQAGRHSHPEEKSEGTTRQIRGASSVQPVVTTRDQSIERWHQEDAD
jgi:hypothetical protein